MNKVFVTGMGLLTPLGNTLDEFWTACLSGKSGVGRISKFDPSSFPSQMAGEIKNFDPLDYMDKKTARRNDPFVHFCFAAVQSALDHSDLDRETLESMDRTQIGVIIGSGIGGITSYTKNDIAFFQSGWKKVSPFFIPSIITNMASGLISIHWNLQGPNFSISTACATANNCILEAMHIIRRGEAEIMLAGGVEAALTPLGLAGFCSSRALSTRNDEPTKASRPFDLNRDGFVMGEGAGVLVLESEESAERRGATIYGEVLGGAMTSDAYHITAPREDAKGVIHCMKKALENSKIEPEQVDYINAHGTSTTLGDQAECMAIQKVFEKHSKNLKISSTKSMIGHLLGGAGAVEAIAVLQSFESGQLHPTINQENPDPKMELNFIPNQAIDFQSNIALSNSFGFGGHNCSLVFKRA